MGTLVDGVSPPGTTNHHCEPCYFDSIWSVLTELVVYGLHELPSLELREHLVHTTHHIIYELLFNGPHHVSVPHEALSSDPTAAKYVPRLELDDIKMKHVYALSVKCSRTYTREMTSRSTYLTSPLRFIHQCPH